MKFLKQWKVPVIAVLLTGLSLPLIYKREVKYYLQYYVTRIADKYDLLDYGQLPAYRKLSAGFGQVNKNLDQLNRKVEGMLDKKGQKSEPLEFPPYYDREPDNKDILRRIYLLSVLINRLDTKEDQKPVNGVLTYSKKLTENEFSFFIDLPRNREIINQKFIIKNQGNQKLINPRIIVNDQKKWFNIESILQEIIKPGMTGEEKALSIWKFLNKNLYRYYPATERSETHDVVKYLNAYGYGYCDDTATSFYLLARKAGLKGRVWGLKGHVVSEVFYNNDWHLLDSDHQVFYLEKDNKTLASVEDLANHPELIYRTPRNADPSIGKLTGLANLYASKKDNYLGEYWMSGASGNHTLDYRLRPGESFEGCRQGEGRYISNGRYLSKRPPEYGTGKFTYQPIFKEKIFRESVLSEKNIKIMENKLTLSQSGRPGYFVIGFQTPYPITGAQIVIELTIKGNDSLTVSFSQDNKKWWEISRFTGQHTSKSAIKDISNYFPNGYDDPLYKYFLKFELSGSKADSLTIDKLTVITDTQLAPRSLPELSGGRNKVTYLSDGPRHQAAIVEFQYSLGQKYHPSPKPSRSHKIQINPKQIMFSWKAPETEALLEYNFQLSSRSDFLVPLTPKFDIITKNPQVIVDRKWLNKGRTYYWRTRSRYVNQPWGKFSQGEQLAVD